MRNTKAIALRWRADGIPGVITFHEAYRLSGGLVGREGNHRDPVSLSAVAVVVSRQPARLRALRGPS